MNRPNRYNSYPDRDCSPTYIYTCMYENIDMHTNIDNAIYNNINKILTNNDPTSILTTIRQLSSSLVCARVHARVRPPIHSPYLRWSQSVDLSAPLPPCASAARKEEDDVETCAFICANVPF